MSESCLTLPASSVCGPVFAGYQIFAVNMSYVEESMQSVLGLNPLKIYGCNMDRMHANSTGRLRYQLSFWCWNFFQSVTCINKNLPNQCHSTCKLAANSLRSLMVDAQCDVKFIDESDPCIATDTNCFSSFASESANCGSVCSIIGFTSYTGALTGCIGQSDACCIELLKAATFPVSTTLIAPTLSPNSQFIDNTVSPSIPTWAIILASVLFTLLTSLVSCLIWIKCRKKAPLPRSRLYTRNPRPLSDQPPLLNTQTNTSRFSLPMDEPRTDFMIAFHDYEAYMQDELTLKVGDEIFVLEKFNDGWGLGVCHGIQGAFPLGCCISYEELSLRESEWETNTAYSSDALDRQKSESLGGRYSYLRRISIAQRVTTTGRRNSSIASPSFT